ncbi:zinc finger protein 431-like [Sitophilus oryzae]|uniref:Zinc finger protein 431-like n=1 Tax=Sitophilus oryzae TaxID=7048 RepID=A0A6J2YQJ1_SITOR|nr:zinc finger protein 431-like [Sitophilus oryzae]
MTSNTNVCLICNASCLSSRNTIKIFDKDSAVISEISIPVTIGRILKRDVRKDNVHSEILCKKCFKLVDEYEEIQNRMGEISKEISDNYKANIESRQIETDHMQESSNRENNELPKKILDIPSSDDESSQVIEKPLESLEDINMVLVKMHDTPMEDDDDIENGSQNYQPIHVNSDGEEQEPSSETGEKITFIKVEPNVSDTSSNDQTQVSHTPDTSKPNILKRRASSNGITYGGDSIGMQSVKLKPTEELEAPIVSRDGKAYTCLLCVGDEVTGEDKEIIAHMKEAHECRLYICDVCGMDFRKRNLLSAHVDEHVANEEGDFQCEVCNRIFTNLRLFRIHRRMHLPPAKAWSCSTCAKRFSSKNLLDEHVNMHLGVRPYVCNVCGKDFASKYTFKAHERTHENRPRPYRCEQCGKSFLSQQNLTQHEKTHLGIKEFECHLCNKQFGSANNLEVHSIVHTGYRPFICGLCGKTFARKAEIKDHERTHTGERPYQCEFCGATFSQRSNLQSHKRATHYDDKRYRCEDCGKCFKRRRLLDYHIKAAHTGERPFKCEVCQATFVYPEHFKKHRRIHTGEKPFSCEICGKAFNSRDNRNAHRYVHSDKKPYECLVCGAGFMRKPLLYQHMQLQGHLNDTIVVNQPRLTLDDKLVMDSESHLVRVEEESSANESKLFIAAEDGNEHIIIDGQHITFAETTSDNEDDNGEVIDEIEQVVGTEEAEYEEILTSEALTSSETQIIDTPDGPIQLVKVKIPNEHGEEEEAWIKIVPE